MRIACVVEGHGEREAVPVLLQRIAALQTPAVFVEVAACLRVPRDKLIKAGELERTVELAARRAAPDGSILVLIDADDACPAELGPALLERARKARSNVPISVVVAKKEFEAWFLAAAESIRGKRGLAGDLVPPADPESIRGAKEWLTRHRMDGRAYSETRDQPALTAVFNLEAARRADSFDKFLREVSRLMALSGQRPSRGE